MVVSQKSLMIRYPLMNLKKKRNRMTSSSLKVRINLLALSVPPYITLTKPSRDAIMPAATRACCDAVYS